VKAAGLGAALGLATAAAIATAASCSIDHRSDDFTCETTSDCPGTRICEQGFCVQAGPGTPDARRTPDARPPDADPCPAQCTSCDVATNMCVIDCEQAGDLCLTDVVRCPPGWRCDIRCNVQSSCRLGIGCLSAEACQVTCSGENACRTLQCGPGPCAVDCIGQDSCRNIKCNNSCACGVTCSGQGSCLDTVTCTSFACDTGLGCSTFPFGCNTCSN
jgi:hypothetical protein